MTYEFTSAETGRTFTFPSEEAYERAQDWYNAPTNSKKDMIEFCANHGVNISADESTLVEEWADIAMETFARASE